MRLQREITVTTEKTDPNLLRFETVTSRGDLDTVRNLAKATIGAQYLRPVTSAVFHPDRYPPRFERMRSDLQKCDSPYVKPLPSHLKMSKQQPGRYEKSMRREKDFMRDPVTLLPMEEEVLQKARIVLFVESTMMSSSNMNYTLTDVRRMFLFFAGRHDLSDVKDFRSCSRRDHQTPPFPSLLQCDRPPRTAGHMDVF